MLNAGLYVDENVSNDDRSNAVPAVEVRPKKFLLFNVIIFKLLENVLANRIRQVFHQSLFHVHPLNGMAFPGTDR